MVAASASPMRPSAMVGAYDQSSPPQHHHLYGGGPASAQYN
eukprot:CAMPEP_0185576130 /NCGR_PEP_ID=MMETSP0434-20130131/7126_1 /TAXON_ID=626734 ORGANISM="Favella taraikaensis, Strain Fe Narragansett Bay" /NCGR_SAMPLE_ID=MMETSP0434 /ASSEMBLY_ACC=CAM_ASM_000379 /LENGTH=40 /DNA_ID= /DNA_START= /DNA_END= /DNA_ORIENTATION=